MLEDEHFKVLEYEQDSSKVFMNTDIKGGIAITYRDRIKKYGPIKTFSQYEEVNRILKKVISTSDYESIDEIVYSRTSFRMTKKVHEDFPDAKKELSDGHLYDMSSNIFQRLPYLFSKEKNDESDVRVLGREDSSRIYKYINREYINSGRNLNMYKVFIPQAFGRGDFGEGFGVLEIGKPGDASTETFLSIGAFESAKEAENLIQYLKSKFCRCLISVLKVTQIGNKPVYKYVPLQDFTSNSDIDWSKSVAKIDQQLYKKYGLSQEEIDFIETHVKEMV